MQLDKKSNEVVCEIRKYYANFKEIYNKDNYPEWFKFCDNYNKKFIKTKRYDNEGHELGHYSIFYTPIPDEIKIMIVGNNSSWFVDKIGDKSEWFKPNNCGHEFSASSRYEKALNIVTKIQEDIPVHNLYTKGIFKFGRDLEDYFKDPSINKMNYYEYNTVGLNRLWIQHGPSGSNHVELQKNIKNILNKPSCSNGDSLAQVCEKLTKKIIWTLQPQYLLLFGGPAQKLYREGNFGSMSISHLYHPVYTGKKDNPVTKKDKIKQFRNAIAGMLNE